MNYLEIDLSASQTSKTPLIIWESNQYRAVLIGSRVYFEHLEANRMGEPGWVDADNSYFGKHMMREMALRAMNNKLIAG